MMQADRKKFFRRTSVRIILIFLLLLIMMVIYLSIVAIDRPPQVNNLDVLEIKRTEISKDSYAFGPNWLRKSESGLWEAYIEGDPFERGVAFGQLTRELLYFQESSFFEQIKEFVPSDGYLKVLKYFIAFFNRNLDKSIPEEYKQEIYGTSFACDPSFDFIGSGYQRQLNYHAAHDIGHALQGLRLVACTSFSVWDGKSADSSLLIGRNFDFYMGEKFAENKIICFVRPDNGYKFMMVTWADLIGVVSGMNEKGLTVTLNAAKSGIPLQAATPVTLLAREILQYASDIEEAYSIALKRDLFVSESIMIGSARDHQTAIIEKSPGQTALYDPEGNQIICSNHYQSETFANDRKNEDNIRESDSYDRYRRVEELLNRSEFLNVTDMARILRDRLVLGDTDAGMGNKLAINQLIAHHSVIFKPDSLLVWVSTAPWQLGKYVAYDLNKIFNLRQENIHQEIHIAERSLPADSFLFSSQFQQYKQFRHMGDQLRTLMIENQKLPGGFIEDYINTNPSFYMTYTNLGDYFNEMKNFSLALEYYNKALACRLPGLDEKVKITVIKEKLLKKIN
jgi:isopenicillin-N N-acyltransferase-like protein